MTVDVMALIRKAAVAALNAQAEIAQAASQGLAPKDSLALSESIKVEDANTQSLTAQVYSNADHAIYQHEALDLVHPTGQAKYMESAVESGRAAIEAAGAAAAKRVLG